MDNHLVISPHPASPPQSETPARVENGAEKGNLVASTGRKLGSMMDAARLKTAAAVVADSMI
jgi:hypothetical protein